MRSVFVFFRCLGNFVRERVSVFSGKCAPTGFHVTYRLSDVIDSVTRPLFSRTCIVKTRRDEHRASRLWNIGLRT